jgi:uncharacterized membrane protein YwaF
VLILLAIYPAVFWGWELKLKDVFWTVIVLNGVALMVAGLNVLLNSNYLYVMERPPGATFFALLPEWPYYILILELILASWSLILWALFRWVKRRCLVIYSDSKPTTLTS